MKRARPAVSAATTGLLAACLALSSCSAQPAQSGTPTTSALTRRCLPVFKSACEGEINGAPVTIGDWSLTAQAFLKFGSSSTATGAFVQGEFAVAYLGPGVGSLRSSDWKVLTPAGEIVGADVSTRMPVELVNGGRKNISLSFRLPSEGPYVLAFVPGSGTARAEWGYEPTQQDLSTT